MIRPHASLGQSELDPLRRDGYLVKPASGLPSDVIDKKILAPSTQFIRRFSRKYRTLYDHIVGLLLDQCRVYLWNASSSPCAAPMSTCAGDSLRARARPTGQPGGGFCQVSDDYPCTAGAATGSKELSVTHMAMEAMSAGTGQKDRCETRAPDATHWPTCRPLPSRSCSRRGGSTST